MEKWHAAKPKSIANGAGGGGAQAVAASQAGAAAVHAGLRRGAGARVPARRARHRDHRRDELRHRAEHPAGRCPTATSTSASPSSRRCCSPPGLALQGCKPVAAIYSTFLQRAYDQIVHDVCLQKLNVVFAMDRAGLVGDDGPTHHGAFDIAYLRCLPNIVLMAPRDEAMLVHMLRTALAYDDGPVALRYPRGEGVGVPLPARPEPIAIGTGEILREGDARRAARLRHGVGKALEAADLLAERGIVVTVADARFAKPIDAGLVAQLAAEHELLVTVEEGVLAGGFGSAVWETLSDAGLGAADPARRPARPLRHPRRARAAARGGRLHRRAHRRADRGRRRRAQRRRLAPERRALVQTSIKRLVAPPGVQSGVTYADHGIDARRSPQSRVRQRRRSRPVTCCCHVSRSWTPRCGSSGTASPTRRWRAGTRVVGSRIVHAPVRRCDQRRGPRRAGGLETSPISRSPATCWSTLGIPPVRPDRVVLRVSYETARTPSCQPILSTLASRGFALSLANLPGPHADLSLLDVFSTVEVDFAQLGRARRAPRWSRGSWPVTGAPLASGADEPQ